MDVEVDVEVDVGAGGCVSLLCQCALLHWTLHAGRRWAPLGMLQQTRAGTPVLGVAAGPSTEKGPGCSFQARAVLVELWSLGLDGWEDQDPPSVPRVPATCSYDQDLPTAQRLSLIYYMYFSL